MSLQAPSSFNFGFHRRLMASVNMTPAGGNIPCPLCGGPTKSIVLKHDGEPDGSLTAAIHCHARDCFSVIQRIERSDTPTVTQEKFNEWMKKFMQ